MQEYTERPRQEWPPVTDEEYEAAREYLRWALCQGPVPNDQLFFGARARGVKPNHLFEVKRREPDLIECKPASWWWGWRS